MPSALGNAVFGLIRNVPALHRFVSRWFISTYADSGVLPGLYNTRGQDRTSLRELLDKENFALVVPPPTQDEINTLPEIDKLVDLFRRTGDPQESRVSVLLPFFAQHLTDAVFQSVNDYATDAPHEIILNQIYGNTREDEAALRLGQNGKLRSQTRDIDGQSAEYPDALMEEQDGAWVIKDRYKGLSYLLKPGKEERLRERYKGREGDICATGLFQGNMTLGNFAITTLMLREHNRLCDGILQERRRKGLPTDDEAIFRVAQQNNVTAYMKVVIEDYINAFAGQKVFMLDTKSFFHEAKRWCRETPLPFHFNILYRIHSMIPDMLKGHEDKGFSAFLAQNGLVMQTGIGRIFETASSQGAYRVGLGNTHDNLIPAEKQALIKARKVLGSFNAHRIALGLDPVGFDAFDPGCRDQLRELYGNDPDRVEYAVGIFAEQPETGIAEKLGLKDPSIIGDTLLNAIAKHAFRHILSNRFMTEEFLNRQVLGDFGWDNLHSTSTVADLVKRNVAGEMSQSDADQLRVSFENPN